MGTKKAAKKKTAAKKAPTKRVAKKTPVKKNRAREKAAAKRLPKAVPRTSKTTRNAWAEPPMDDMPSVDEVPDEAAAPHEHLEPRELSHERLRNAPEETVMPALNEDLVDDVAAQADGVDGDEVEDDS